jgi:hypothetical protein
LSVVISRILNGGDRVHPFLHRLILSYVALQLVD